MSFDPSKNTFSATGTLILKEHIKTILKHINILTILNLHNEMSNRFFFVDSVNDTTFSKELSLVTFSKVS